MTCTRRSHKINFTLSRCAPKPAVEGSKFSLHGEALSGRDHSVMVVAISDLILQAVEWVKEHTMRALFTGRLSLSLN